MLHTGKDWVFKVCKEASIILSNVNNHVYNGYIRLKATDTIRKYIYKITIILIQFIRVDVI